MIMGLFRKSDARIRAEASRWVARLEGGSATEEDRRAFRRWQEEDPRHGEAYRRIEGIFAGASRLGSGAAARPVKASAAPASGMTGLALAASIAAVALVAVLLLVGGPFGSDRGETYYFATALGEIREVDLPDGSRIVLDTASELEAEYGPSVRHVELRRGRARFAVAPDGRPFVVRAGTREIRAGESLFDVSENDGEVAVVLLEGRLAVGKLADGDESAGPPAAIRPGEKIVLPEAGPAVRRPASRADQAWPTRMLELEETPLGEAVALANRYSEVKLSLGDPDLARLRVTGAFRSGDTAGLARSAAAAFGLRVERAEDGGFVLVEPDASPR